MTEEVNLYRIKLIRWNWEKEDDPNTKDDYRDYCIKNNLLACGWPARVKCKTFNEYKDNVEKMFHNPKEFKKLSFLEQEKVKQEKPYDNHSSWATVCNAMNRDMKAGDLCWTQGKDGKYYLGKIKDKEIYFNCPNHPQIGIYKEVEEWKGFELDAIPGDVIRSLIGGKTLQQIKSVTIKRYSENLYNGKKQKNLERIEDLLHPDDLEDLLGLYLQKEKKYFVFPSTNKTGTACYEYMLVNKAGKKAIIQCKTGNSDIDDTQSLIKERKNITVYITTLAENKKYPGAIVVPFKTLTEWASKEENMKVLPDRIKNYLEWSK